ncbi:reverse transcriptase [Tanacetum coccineum]
MVNTRSTNNGGRSQGGVLTSSTTVESQMTRTSQRREHLGGQNGQNGGNNGGSYGRLTKVEFPKFDGEDVQGWLYRVNKFFKMDQIFNDDQRIRLVSMHVFGKALNWHKQFMKRFGEVVNWDVYETQIKKRFEPVFEDPVVELKNLKQTTNVQLTQQELEEKRAKHLCFYCDQRYRPDHKCSGQMYSLEVVACDKLIEDEDCELTKQGIMSEEETMPQISLNAMTEVNNYQTIRIKGHVGKQLLHILVDCGSTHNFLDLYAAKRLGYIMILPLGGCEMVLGIQWLSTLGTIQFDFKDLMIGNTTQPKPQVQTLLKDFAKVFDTPNELPPNTSHDHTIPLAPNTPPINIMPYKHLPIQKDAIELMVNELMEASIIRNNQSSFSSPIIMVKKKDVGVKLNKHTIKDKFPIPVIEELLDELNGAKVFTKLDLRSGYHQIRMNEADIHKIAFRTHEGVSTDPDKIQAMESWPEPQKVKQLRGFLGLSGYYRKFINNYAMIIMTQTPVLGLPSFQKTFVVETDASSVGIEAVLQQEGNHITYLSKTSAPKHQSLSTYKNELLVVLMALERWRGYLLDRHFKIKTDHFSLKYLLNERLTTPFI